MIWVARKAVLRDRRAIQQLQVTENRPQRTDLQITEYIVASIGEEIVGCIAARCVGGVGYIYGLVVAKKWRKIGIGHFLTQRCIEQAVRAGAIKIYLLSMFWNVRFFKKHGFVLVARSAISELAVIHQDFNEAWVKRSALLCLTVTC